MDDIFEIGLLPFGTVRTLSPKGRICLSSHFRVESRHTTELKQNFKLTAHVSLSGLPEILQFPSFQASTSSWRQRAKTASRFTSRRPTSERMATSSSAKTSSRKTSSMLASLGRISSSSTVAVEVRSPVLDIAGAQSCFVRHLHVC